MGQYRFTTLIRPFYAPDGDTIYFDRVDRGEGHIQVSSQNKRKCFKLRIVGPGGEWFDAAEAGGRRASAEGRDAKRIMREVLEPVIDGGLWLACQTFKNERQGTIDTFGRFLYFPYAVVDPARGFEQTNFDIVATLVAAGVATLGSRFGEGKDE